MHNFQQKKGFRYFLKSKPALVILSVILIFFFLNVFSLFNKMLETRDNKKMTEEKTQELEARKNKLTEDIAKLNTDKGKEEVFRENYGFSKDGEGMIVIVDDKNDVNQDNNTVKRSFWSSLKNLFK